jgi:acylphosphatase
VAAPDTAGSAASEPPTRASLHAIVHGRVQGVGFRQFVRRKALVLGLRGWVRNLDDGRSVELDAAGERTALAALLELVRAGPSFAHVTRVQHDWSDAGAEGAGFEIRF